MNSLADIVPCALGFTLTNRVGFRPTAVLFGVRETVFALWIRDGPIPNIVVLIHPIEALREWQVAGR